MHPVTRRRVEILESRPKQSVLIVGEEGSGKHSLALGIIADLLNVSVNKLENHPYLLKIFPEKNSISIESIREIEKFIKLKVSDKSQINRVILIEDAGKMGREAQNALLKMLEEPPKNTMFLLTVSSKSELLPTIKSRVSEISILPVDQATAKEFFSNYSEQESEKAYLMSGGKPALMAEILSGDSDVQENIDLAKQILGESVSARLLRVDDLVKNKEDLAKLLNSLQSICFSAFRQSIRNNPKNIRIWHERQIHIEQAIKQLNSNTNTKLLLDNLFINL